MSDEFIENINVAPDKRVLVSISKDIDLYHGICELIDNSIDNWRINKCENDLIIKIFFFEDENRMEYEDNSGGIKEKDFPMIIQPGGTLRTFDEETIGIFGVGSKRALISLSNSSEALSRHSTNDTFKIIIDENWVKEKEWSIKKYKTTNIDPGQTKFILNKLKFKIDEKTITEIKELIGSTYAFYLEGTKIRIIVNGSTITPIIFNSWAYPPLRGPRKYLFDLKEDINVIKLELTVGLMIESSQKGDWGFDLYCNDRLILRNVTDYRLGFKSKELGLPHATSAWFKGIIRINGKNRYMPWNSSKSNIDLLNPTYRKLIEILLKYAKPYIQLSRRLSSSSDEDIKPYPLGEIIFIDFRTEKTPENIFPTLPPGRENYFIKAMKENQNRLKKDQWSRGLLENILVVDSILNTNLQNRNRYALILLDSCLEIAFKDYLRWKKGIQLIANQICN
jgi:hypothetical protein